jgi:hypothetical protein
MKSTARLKKAVPTGFVLNEPKEFFGEVSRRLKVGLGLPYVRLQTYSLTKERGACYFTETAPILLQGEERALPALPLHSANGLQSWVVVEVEYEGGQPAVLQHVSLKVHHGPTIADAVLCFRAEWDVRDADSKHAQPHWNVHALPFGETASTQPTRDFLAYALEEGGPTFAEFAATAGQGNGGDTEQVAQAATGYSAKRMHEFHFAMAVEWSRPGERHSPLVTSADQIASWISGCVLYVRSQLETMA